MVEKRRPKVGWQFWLKHISVGFIFALIGTITAAAAAPKLIEANQKFGIQETIVTGSTPFLYFDEGVVTTLTEGRIASWTLNGENLAYFSPSDFPLVMNGLQQHPKWMGSGSVLFHFGDYYWLKLTEGSARKIEMPDEFRPLGVYGGKILGELNLTMAWFEPERGRLHELSLSARNDSDELLAPEALDGQTIAGWSYQNNESFLKIFPLGGQPVQEFGPVNRIHYRNYVGLSA